MRLLRLVLAVAAACLLGACGGDPDPPSAPQAPSALSVPSPGTASAGPGLIAQLRQGGYVLYIRHAATESAQDDPTPDLNDPGTQRNLSAAGRTDAREIGQAVRRLRIPIGTVLVSPYDRTRETAEIAFGAGRPRETRELISEGFPGTDDARLAEQLRRLLRQRPSAGTNTVLVSHGFNITEAADISIAEGDMVVFNPAARQPLTPVATIGVDDWRSLRG
ncbi:MAG TPA: histidine phosphatase family protein [Streptosporangiaceae bacterium]|nr:histidine phosphatase family protein [Streptosporangiaceae bacterium]